MYSWNSPERSCGTEDEKLPGTHYYRPETCSPSARGHLLQLSISFDDLFHFRLGLRREKRCKQDHPGSHYVGHAGDSGEWLLWRRHPCRAGTRDEYPAAL